MNRRLLTALPVYNERSHVLPVLREVRQFSDQILVVDDGSSDGTSELLDEQTDLHVIHHTTNLGYGAALASAFRFAIQQEYDALVTIDCDGQHQPALIPQLADALDSDGVAWDMVSGSRYLQSFPGDSRPPADRQQINRQITARLNQVLKLDLTDTFCGFKAYRVESLPELQITETGYAMPLQLWVQAWRHDWKIREFAVPLVYLEEERSFGGSLDDARRRLAYYEEVLVRELGETATALNADFTDPTGSSAGVASRSSDEPAD